MDMAGSRMDGWQSSTATRNDRRVIRDDRPPIAIPPRGSILLIWKKGEVMRRPFIGVVMMLLVSATAFAGRIAGAGRGDRDCTQIDIAGAKSTSAMAINPRGDIAGQFTDASNVTHGFFIDYPDGQVSIIDVPGAKGTTAVGINPEGDIVGRYDDATGRHGY